MMSVDSCKNQNDGLAVEEQRDRFEEAHKGAGAAEMLGQGQSGFMALTWPSQLPCEL